MNALMNLAGFSTSNKVKNQSCADCAARSFAHSYKLLTSISKCLTVALDANNREVKVEIRKISQRIIDLKTQKQAQMNCSLANVIKIRGSDNVILSIHCTPFCTGKNMRKIVEFCRVKL